MKGNRKQAVSIRLSSSDVRKMKVLAKRLGVRDSDVLRYALKAALNQLAGLCDPDVKGSALVPTVVEAGADFVRYFELDAARLDAIINAGADTTRHVSHDDIALISMAGSQPEYAMLRLRRPAPEGVRVVTGTPASVDALRQHLYQKYLYRDGDEGWGGRHADSYAAEPVEAAADHLERASGVASQ